MKRIDAIFSSASTRKIPKQIYFCTLLQQKQKVTLEKLAIAVEKYPFSL